MKLRRMLSNMTSDKKGLQKRTAQLRHSYDDVNHLVQTLIRRQKPSK